MGLDTCICCRILLLALSISVLAGCATEASKKRQAQQREAIERQQRAQMEQKCSSYGFKQNTPDFSRCLMTLDQQRMQQRARESEAQYNRDQKSLGCLMANGYNPMSPGYNNCMAR